MSVFFSTLLCTSFVHCLLLFPWQAERETTITFHQRLHQYYSSTSSKWNWGYWSLGKRRVEEEEGVCRLCVCFKQGAEIIKKREWCLCLFDNKTLKYEDTLFQCSVTFCTIFWFLLISCCPFYLIPPPGVPVYKTNMLWMLAKLNMLQDLCLIGLEHHKF